MQNLKSISKDAFLAKYPLDQLWRFFVDGPDQKKGWYRFEENEPGYLLGTYRAFLQECCLEHFEEPLSAQVLMRIHRHALMGVRHTGFDRAYQQGISLFGKFRMSEVLFPLDAGLNVSPAGYREILTLTQLYAPFISIRDEKLSAQNTDSAKQVDRILARYHHELSLSNYPDDKLKAIIHMASETERMHPFMDGNCRSICMILVMRECLKHNLYPPIVDDPNQYDGFSQQELYQKALKGMDRTYEIIQTGQMSTPFEKIIMYLKSNPEKKYNARETRSYIDEIDSFEFIYTTEEDQEKLLNDSKPSSIEAADKNTQDYLLASIFLESWATVEQTAIFQEEGLKKEFERQLTICQGQHQRETEILINKINRESVFLSKMIKRNEFFDFFRSHGDKNILGDEGVLFDLIRFNCFSVFKQIFSCPSIEPPLFYQLTSYSQTSGRKNFEEYLSQKMISSFMLKYIKSENQEDSKEDKALSDNHELRENCEKIEQYWAFFEDMSSLFSQQLRDKVMLERSKQKVSAPELKRKVDKIIQQNESNLADNKSEDRIKKARLAL